MSGHLKVGCLPSHLYSRAEIQKHRGRSIVFELLIVTNTKHLELKLRKCSAIVGEIEINNTVIVITSRNLQKGAIKTIWCSIVKYIFHFEICG